MWVTIQTGDNGPDVTSVHYDEITALRHVNEHARDCTGMRAVFVTWGAVWEQIHAS